MGQQVRDGAGNIWEVDGLDAAGNPIGTPRLVTAAGGGRVVNLPPNPEKVAAAARQAERDAASDADRAADNARADEALALQREAAAKKGPHELSPEDRAEVAAEAQQKIQLIDRLIERSKNGWFATGFGANTAAMVPGSTARDVANDVQTVAASGALQRIMEMARNNGGKNPLTPLSNADFNALGQSIANLDPSQSDEQFQRNLLVYRNIYERALGAAGPADQRAEREVDPVTGAARADANTPSDPGNLPPANMPGGNDPTPPANTPGGGGPLTPWELDHGPTESGTDTGVVGFGASTRQVDHPEIRSMVASLVNSGAGLATINAALKEAKWNRPVSLQQWGAIEQWRKANPGKPYPASAVDATETVPLSYRERFTGSDTGALLAQMANSATGGIPGYLAGDEGKRALAAMEAAHPDSSTTGTIAGGITGAAGAELGLAARAPAALARYAPRMADALYGATSGFTGAEDGNRLQGALTGAVLAPIAGRAGEAVMGGVGATLRGVTNPAVQRLREAGIPLTVGEMVAQGGIVGRGIKKIEDAMTSIPGVGNMIDARRREGWEGLNRAAFDVGAETTGGQVQDIGSAGVAGLRDLVGDTYSRALDNVTLDAAGDPLFPQGLMQAQLGATAIPQVGDDAANALAFRVDGGMAPDGTMTGRDFQEAYRGLARDARAAPDAYSEEYRGVMREGQDLLGEALERQNPGAFEGFIAANTANRRANVLADAVNAAKNQQDELFSPAQLNTADANSATRLTGRLNSASGNRPFYQLASDAQQVMGNRLPNSGTADRMWTGLALGGLAGGGTGYVAGDAGTGTGVGLGATLALMAGGTRRGQMLARELLLNRPDILRAAGEGIQRNARIAGWTGAGALTPLVVGP